jgi:hypothetical protein
MKTKFSLKTLVLPFTLIVFVLIVPFMPVRAADQVDIPAFSDFTTAVQNGQAGVVRGVYVPGLFALPVVQQPADNGGYITTTDGVVTQFGLAAQYGTIGLLAHNNLAGSNFIALIPGQVVQLVYGDGQIKDYVVELVYRFQALQPYSEMSDFVDLASGQQYIAWDVFNMVFAGGDHVTFETCIEANGKSSWGRLFIVALPYVANNEPAVFSTRLLVRR